MSAEGWFLDPETGDPWWKDSDTNVCWLPEDGRDGLPPQWFQALAALIQSHAALQALVDRIASRPRDANDVGDVQIELGPSLIRQLDTYRKDDPS